MKKKGNNKKLRAELYRSITLYSQNILSNAILKSHILNTSKHLLTSRITVVLILSNQENLLIKTFSDLEEIAESISSKIIVVKKPAVFLPSVPPSVPPFLPPFSQSLSFLANKTSLPDFIDAGET